MEDCQFKELAYLVQIGERSAMQELDR